MKRCICGKEFENGRSYASHTKWCKVYCESVGRDVEVSKAFDEYHKQNRSWNRGLTNSTDSRVKRISEKQSNTKLGKKGKPHTSESRKKISDTMKRKAANGELHGFMVRGKESYAEKFWRYVLDNNGISYKREYRVPFSAFGIDKKCASYFLDFYIEDVNLDLEIDGSQHRWATMVERDKLRDERLESIGFNIYRIPYVSPVYKDRVKRQIDEFIKYYWLLKGRIERDKYDSL